MKSINKERVYVTKFVGIFIDHNLDWKQHFLNLSRNLSKVISVIRKASDVINANALYTLYRSTFCPTH